MDVDGRQVPLCGDGKREYNLSNDCICYVIVRMFIPCQSREFLLMITIGMDKAECD